MNLFDGRLDESGRIVGDLPGQVLGKSHLHFGYAVANRLERCDRVGAGRLIDRHDGGRATIEPRIAIEIGGA